MRPLDVVAWDLFYGEGHHLVIDVSFSPVLSNATIQQSATIPDFVAAAHREQAKFDMLLTEHPASQSRGWMVMPTCFLRD